MCTVVNFLHFLSAFFVCNCAAQERLIRFWGWTPGLGRNRGFPQPRVVADPSCCKYYFTPIPRGVSPGVCPVHRPDATGVRVQYTYRVHLQYTMTHM